MIQYLTDVICEDRKFWHVYDFTNIVINDLFHIISFRYILISKVVLFNFLEQSGTDLHFKRYVGKDNETFMLTICPVHVLDNVNAFVDC